MLPSGSFRLCTMLTTQPTLKISLGLGSSMEASCWVARKIFLSPAMASSRARTLDSRPTTNGVIMNGKITTSRMGIIGNRLVSDFSFEVSILVTDVGCWILDVGKNSALAASFNQHPTSYIQHLSYPAFSRSVRLIF